MRPTFQTRRRDPKDTRRARGLCTIEEGGRAGHSCRKPAVAIYRRKADGFEALRCRYHDKFMGTALLETGAWEKLPYVAANAPLMAAEPEAGR